MKFIEKLFAGAGVIAILGYITLIILAFAGYVMNILAIVAGVTGSLTLLLIIRVVGCFVFPLGAILGWF